MSGTPSLIKTFVKDGAIAPFRIVVAGSADNTVAQAAAATHPAFGISNRLGAPDAADLRVDVVLSGVWTLELGATVTAGTPLMADASGRGITATAGHYVAAVARHGGISGDLVSVIIQPFYLGTAPAG